MQFGRFHGALLIVLGLLLLGAELWIYAAPHSTRPDQLPAPSSPINGNPVVPAPDHLSLIQIFPGILGVFCLAAGAGIYIRDRNKPADVPVHPIR